MNDSHCPVTGKVCYRTEKQAEATIEHQHFSAMAYRCPECDKWHITHAAKQATRRRELIRAAWIEAEINEELKRYGA